MAGQDAEISQPYRGGKAGKLRLSMPSSGSGAWERPRGETDTNKGCDRYPKSGSDFSVV